MTIDRHPAVARLLDLQAVLRLGARAICYDALVALELEWDSPLVDFLTPVCKVFATDVGVAVADMGLQVRLWLSPRVPSRAGAARSSHLPDLRGHQ